MYFSSFQEKPPIINYGMGMAYSFYEGYLAHILPSDGASFVGFEENINIYESSQGVVFPVKRLFLVISKSLYCPPDLKQFNKSNTNLPYMEACKVSDEVSFNFIFSGTPSHHWLLFISYSFISR